MGEEGIEAIVEAYYKLHHTDPWRLQMESYDVVRERLDSSCRCLKDEL